MARPKKSRIIADPYPQRGAPNDRGQHKQLNNQPTDQSIPIPLPKPTGYQMSSIPTPSTCSTSQTNGAQFKIDKPSAEAFCATLMRFYNNERLADATIRCGDQEFKVHAVVLSAHSDFFYKVFCGQWKESEDGKIVKLEEVEVDIVQAMIQFIYHFDYRSPDGVAALLFNAKVYSIADRYLIPKLKDYSKTKFESAVSRLSGSADLSDLCAVSSEVYSSTPESDRGLRDIVTEAFHKDLSILEKSEPFHTALREIPQLAVDMVFFKPKARQSTFDVFY